LLVKPTTISIVLLLGCAAWPVAGIEALSDRPSMTTQEGLRRCVGPDGGTIFTDRRCSDLQAVDMPERDALERPGAVVVRVRTCARNQNDLLAGVRAALENHDANRLADYYHWTGMGTAQGYRVLDRLSAFSQRPVVDVQLVSSQSQTDYDLPDIETAVDFSDAYAETGTELDSELDSDSDSDPDALADASVPVRRTPAAHLLRVDQMRGKADVAAEITYFHLLNNAGCWWMRF